MGGRGPQHRESARVVTRHRSARRHDSEMATHKSFCARQRVVAPAGVSHPRSACEAGKCRCLASFVVRGTARAIWDTEHAPGRPPCHRSHPRASTAGSMDTEPVRRQSANVDRARASGTGTRGRQGTRAGSPTASGQPQCRADGAARSLGHFFELEPSATSRMSPRCGCRRNSLPDAAPGCQSWARAPTSLCADGYWPVPRPLRSTNLLTVNPRHGLGSFGRRALVVG